MRIRAMGTVVPKVTKQYLHSYRFRVVWKLIISIRKKIWRDYSIAAFYKTTSPLCIKSMAIATVWEKVIALQPGLFYINKKQRWTTAKAAQNFFLLAIVNFFKAIFIIQNSFWLFWWLNKTTKMEPTTVS